MNSGEWRNLRGVANHGKDVSEQKCRDGQESGTTRSVPVVLGVEVPSLAAVLRSC